MPVGGWRAGSGHGHFSCVIGGCGARGESGHSAWSLVMAGSGVRLLVLLGLGVW